MTRHPSPQELSLRSHWRGKDRGSLNGREALVVLRRQNLLETSSAGYPPSKIAGGTFQGGGRGKLLAPGLLLCMAGNLVPGLPLTLSKPSTGSCVHCLGLLREDARTDKEAPSSCSVSPVHSIDKPDTKGKRKADIFQNS